MCSTDFLLALIIVAILYLLYKKRKSGSAPASAAAKPAVVPAIATAPDMSIMPVGVAIPVDEDLAYPDLRFKETPLCNLGFENGTSGDYCADSHIVDDYDREQYTKWLREDVGKEFFR